MVQKAILGEQSLWKPDEMDIEELKAAYKSGKRDFPHSHLPKADLHKAKLEDINLSQAYLYRAILSKAHLKKGFFE